MAVLEQWDLSLEFRFKELDECLWVQYEVYFKWRGQSVFRNDLLKRSPIGWANRSEGALKANDYHEDYFLVVLKKVLEENVRAYWQPTEPDIMVGFFPDEDYPFFPPPPKAIYTADHVIEARSRRKEEKERSGGKLPDDTISMVVYVDAYNWGGCGAYQDQGFCLCMRPQRSALEKFYRTLSREWEAFKVRERLVERVAEDEKRWEEVEDEET